MKIVFLPSAAKHGYTEADALNAITKYQREIIDFDAARRPGLPDTTLHIGPALNGDILEVLSHQIAPHIVVFHCMKLRGKTFIRTTLKDN